jgi:hypothetical protein
MLSYNVSQWTDDSWNANRALQIPTDTSGYLADNFSDNVGTASTPTYGGLGNSSNSGIYTGYDSNHTTHQFSESEIMFSAAFLPVGNYTIHVPMIQRTLEINKDTGAEYGPWAQLPTETFSINVTDPLGVAYSSAKAMNAPVGYERRIMTHEFARDLYPDCSRVFYDDEFGFPISFDNLYLPLIGVTKL